MSKDSVPYGTEEHCASGLWAWILAHPMLEPIRGLVPAPNMVLPKVAMHDIH